MTTTQVTVFSGTDASPVNPPVVVAVGSLQDRQKIEAAVAAMSAASTAFGGPALQLSTLEVVQGQKPVVGSRMQQVDSLYTVIP